MTRSKTADTNIAIDIRDGIDDTGLIALLNNQYNRKPQDEVRAALTRNGHAAWSNEELLDEFEVEIFHPPYVTVIRKRDGVRGTVAFVDTPRVYFHFCPSKTHDAKQSKTV